MLFLRLTASDLTQLRSFGTGLVRPILAADPEAFDVHWELANKFELPRLRLEWWGCLVEARRQNRR